MIAGIEGIGKWIHPVQNWNLTLLQLNIHFKDGGDGYVEQSVMGDTGLCSFL